MAAKRILLLDGPLLTAHYWHAGHITAEGEFGHDAVGLEAFAAYLKKHRASIFYLLADTVEEGFQLEDLPYVQGGDRKALLQRRLGQYYYNTPLSTAISLGRATTGRRDEKILFAALTRIETFTPWLDALRAAEANLAGVYSVPLVLSGSISQTLSGTEPTLFVSLSSGGVRQSFFDQGKLHFSRLSALATKSLEEIARSSANDSAKIYQYLLAQRQIPRGSPLRTIVMAHAGQMPVMEEFCRSSNELEFEFLDIAATARKQGLKDVPADGNADKLFIHGLVRKTPAQQFAPAADTRIYNLWRIRFALTSAAWMVLAGCLLYAGKTALDVYALRDSIEATQVVTATDTQRYNALIDSLPKVGISPDNLRALLERVRRSAETHPGHGTAADPPEPRAEREPENRTDQPHLENCRQHRYRQERPDRGHSGRGRQRRGLGGDRDQRAAPAGHDQRPARPDPPDRKLRRPTARPPNRRPDPQPALRYRIRQAAQERRRENRSSAYRCPKVRFAHFATDVTMK